MSLLVFGTTGQVAQALRALSPDARFLSRADADLSDAAACARAIAEFRPSVVINAAAYTAVDRAESERDAAFAINAAAPAAMARACAAEGAALLHISTDYVFDGSGTAPWKPGDRMAPLNAYGASKLAGEEAIRASGAVHVILRTSWVFSATGNNFLKTMLRLGAERAELSIVADQKGAPTPAPAIASALLAIADRFAAGTGVSGTYHFAGTPDTDWAGFARAIFAASGQKVSVRDIATQDYPTPARRPQNSRLDCSGLERDYSIERPDWQAAVREMVRELTR
jgi:dTDP-4-dehydrorhamnose reductase